MILLIKIYLGTSGWLRNGTASWWSHNLMNLYQIEPLSDPRWVEFLRRHDSASIFHAPGWLEALRLTYGYEPIVVTTSPPTVPLSNGLAFCRINSWLTGHRAVSLPFSDHCEPLISTNNELEPLIASLCCEVADRGWKYVEIRPLYSAQRSFEGQTTLRKARTFYLHRLDLRPKIEDLFQGMHKSCLQRKIRRAKREALAYEEGRSESILRKFYYLFLLTRRRQGLPPQPLTWFKNLIHCLGDSLKIRIASKDGQPITAILTLSFKNSVVYKYGCSDARFHRFGGMPYLFWKAIEEAKELGFQDFDLGRSDIDHTGLITFKDRFRAARSILTYYSYPDVTKSYAGWKMRVVKHLCAHLPDGLLSTAGRLLYRHIG